MFGTWKLNHTQIYKLAGDMDKQTHYNKFPARATFKIQQQSGGRSADCSQGHWAGVTEKARSSCLSCFLPFHHDILQHK